MNCLGVSVAHSAQAHNKTDTGIQQLMSSCYFGRMEALKQESITIHWEYKKQDNDKTLTTSGGSANILMKNFAWHQ